MNHIITRRQFATSIAKTLAIGGTALPIILQACSRPGVPASGSTDVVEPTPVRAAPAASGPAAVSLPSFTPFDTGPKPDLPGNAQGLDPAFFRFPSDLV